MYQLRPYQAELSGKVDEAWTHGARNVVMVLPTGGGKMVILADKVQRHPGASAVIAHRQELLYQLSMALARLGVVHDLIAPQPVRRAITAGHLIETGQSFYRPGARCAVAGIDTLVKRKDLTAWASQVTLWITDEGHHVVEDNKWHIGTELFTHPQCRGLLPTATPVRADGKGLGRRPIGTGVADAMVEGPPMRWLIDEGYLTDYRIVVPESDLQVLGEVGATGDWSTAQLKEASKRSHIVGDAVSQYLRWGRGKLGVTFATDVDTAAEMTAAYRAAGVRAETLTGKTDDGYRRQILRQFAARQLDQIVAVDIVSEGFDLPAIEIESQARPTQSLSLYMQQFGRALRPLYAPGYDLSTREGRLTAIAAGPKSHAIVIDHAANTIRHQGPPDKPRVWTLANRDKRGGGGGIPMTSCLTCYRPYERFHHACPYCGAVKPPPDPTARRSPEFVDGDMAELDAATLARLRGEVAHVDMTLDEYRGWMMDRGVPQVVFLANSKRHLEKQESQAALRQAMLYYGGRCRANGLDDRQIQRLFFLTFGVDVLSAQALGRAEADALRGRIEEALK